MSSKQCHNKCSELSPSALVFASSLTLTSRIVHQAVLKFSPCRKRPLPQAATCPYTCTRAPPVACPDAVSETVIPNNKTNKKNAMGYVQSRFGCATRPKMASVRYDTIRDAIFRAFESKTEISQLNLTHGTKN